MIRAGAGAILAELVIRNVRLLDIITGSDIAPYDAKGLLLAAIRDDVPTGDYKIPLS